MARRITLPKLLGRYQLASEIARGGMATVYLARMLGRGGFERIVAVKVLHPHLSSDPGFVAMFLDEARLAARIRHPNVVDVHDVDGIDGELIIVMSYIEGASLSQAIRIMGTRRMPLPIGFALRVVHDSLLGLHAAHEIADADGHLLGLVHRDVSPHNILVGTDGMARVADFGVAKARGRMATTAGEMLKGKLRYMAPEQLTRETLDRRVDVFAAGAVLWEALVGRPLFAGESEGDIVAMVMGGAIAPPSSLRPDVPPALDAICRKALARRPDGRFQTAADFADAIEEAFSDTMVGTRAVGALIADLAGETLARERRMALPGSSASPPRLAIPIRPAAAATADSHAARATPPMRLASRTREPRAEENTLVGIGGNAPRRLAAQASRDASDPSNPSEPTRVTKITSTAATGNVPTLQRIPWSVRLAVTAAAALLTGWLIARSSPAPEHRPPPSPSPAAQIPPTQIPRAQIPPTQIPRAQIPETAPPQSAPAEAELPPARASAPPPTPAPPALARPEPTASPTPVPRRPARPPQPPPRAPAPPVYIPPSL